MAKDPRSFRLDMMRLDTLSKKLGIAPTDLIEKALSAYDALRNESLKSLQQRFTRKEIIALVDQQNGTMLSPSFQGQVQLYLYELEDNEQLNGMSAQWGINYQQLKEKIEQLSANEVYFLQEEIARFWNEPAAFGSPTPDVDKFIEFLVPYVEPDPKYHAVYRTDGDWMLASPVLGFSSEEQAKAAIERTGAKEFKISTDFWDVIKLIPSKPISREEMFRQMMEQKNKVNPPS